MTADERRNLIIEILERTGRWSTVAYLARHLRERRSQIAVDLQELGRQNRVTLIKADHVLDSGLGMPRQRKVTILLACRRTV
jgi:hypothetical protein